MTMTYSKILIHDLDRNSVAIITLGPARISNNFFRIVHRVNLNQIKDTIDSLTYAHEQDRLALGKSGDFLSPLIQMKIKKLGQSFRKLQPSARTKRWEQLGQIWKYISGSPDAEDLRIINSTSNKLIDQNAKQIKINHMFEDRLNNLTTKFNHLTSSLNNLSSENKRVFESVGLLFSLDEFTQQLENLEEALVLAQHGIPSSRVITADEMTRVQNLLEGSGIFIGALDFASAYVVSSRESIAYILKIPRIKDTEYSLNYIEPVIYNNSRIHIPTNFYLQGQHSFALKSPCAMNRNLYVCSNSQLEPVTKCIQQLLRGELTHCPTERTYTNNIIKRVDDSNLIINDAEVTLTSNCTLTRHLKGSFLVQFSNCTLFINDEMYSNIDKAIRLASFTPTTGLQVNSTAIINKIPIEYLQTLHLEQRDHLDHINLKTDNIHFKLKLIGWSSFGFGSLVIIIFIGTAVIWIKNALTPKLSSHVQDNRGQRTTEDATEHYEDEYPKITMVPQE